MRPFNLEEYLQLKAEGKNPELITSYNEPAEIVKTDCRGLWPILAVVFDGDTDDAQFFNNEGKAYGLHSQCKLFFKD